jgi:hypothetical protein
MQTRRRGERNAASSPAWRLAPRLRPLALTRRCAAPTAGQGLTARWAALRSVAEASAGTLQMNPLVRVAVRPGRPGDPPDAALLADVDVAVLTGASHALELAWDAACRAAGVAFYAAACRGSAAYLFADLREHAFTPTVRGPLDCQLKCRAAPAGVPGHAAARRWSAASLFCRQRAQINACCSTTHGPTPWTEGRLLQTIWWWQARSRGLQKAPRAEADSLHMAGQGVCRAAGRGDGGELQLPAPGSGAVPAVEGAALAAHPPPLLHPEQCVSPTSCLPRPGTAGGLGRGAQHASRRRSRRA